MSQNFKGNRLQSKAMPHNLEIDMVATSKQPTTDIWLVADWIMGLRPMDQLSQPFPFDLQGVNLVLGAVYS